MARSPNLTPKLVRTIVAAIGRMPAPISWERVVAAIRQETGATYTRQALDKHAPISEAYRNRRGGAPARPGGRRLSSQMQAARDQIERHRAEIASLKEQNRRLTDTLVRIHHNAYSERMDVSLLYRNLPPIDRAAAKRSRG